MKPIKIRTIINRPPFEHFISNNLKPGTFYHCKCPVCGKVIVFTPQIEVKGGEPFGHVFCNQSEECKAKKTCISYPFKLDKPTKKVSADKETEDGGDSEKKKLTKPSLGAIHIKKEVEDNDNNEKEQSGKNDNDSGITIRPKRRIEYRNGVITWGRWPFSHSYPLPVGTTLIGRKSKDSPANIQVRDSYMSENSVTIDVLFTERGYTFNLTVKRAANPVYVGARQCPIGSRVPLDDGDIIKMGNTTLRFKLENKKNK